MDSMRRVSRGIIKAILETRLMLSNLFHCHGQVHPWVNSAEDIVGASRGKGAYRVRIVPSKGLVDDGCAVFLFEYRSVVIPGAVLNDMHCAGVINKIEVSTFSDGDGGLHKITIAHVNIVATAPPATID
jgi:hypothetical protein